MILDKNKNLQINQVTLKLDINLLGKGSSLNSDPVL